MSQQDKQPHDKFFRDAFSRTDVATKYLEHFLPSAISQKLDLKSLELQSDSYISPALQDYYSDKVYTCNYAGATKIMITFLLEHKSFPPKHPHFQLLRYQLEIWEHQVKNKQTLTPILPIIIYHGQKKWTYKPISKYFKGIDQELETYLPNFKYHLTDLSHYSDEKLMSLKLGFLLNTFLALKHYKEETYIRQNFGLLLKLEGQDINENFTKVLLVYLFRITEIQPLEFNQLLEQVESDKKTIVMSTYDMLIAEGQKREIEKGKKERQKEKILVIRQAIQEKIPLKMATLFLKLSLEYIKQIQKELSQEKEILTLTKANHSIEKIAKQLAVSELVVEAIQSLDKEKKA